jgi:tellurite resistance protein
MFSKDYKVAVADGKVIPDDRHKTQVAVNSEGKTNEATKNVKEPLQKGQTKPTEKQAGKQTEKQAEKAKEQQQQQEQPKKSRGRKM